MFMKIKTVTIFSIFFLVFLSSNLLFADNKAMVTYIEGTLNTPQYRQWDGISWSGEASAFNIYTTRSSVNPDGSFKISVEDIYEKFPIITAAITDVAYNMGVVVSTSTPALNELSPCAPNPFVVSEGLRFAVINYRIVNAGSVKLKVYNIAGELVKMLVNSHHQPGSYYVKWFGDNGSVGENTGQKVGSGVYIYVIEAEGFRDSGKVILIR